jgi:hypothetical protein
MASKSMFIRMVLAAFAGLALMACGASANAAPRCGGPGHARCDPGFFCQKGVGVCERPDARGVCVRKPRFCDFLEDPVCGCDGRTYTNACTASENGVNIARRGACDHIVRPRPPLGIRPAHPA